MYDPQKDSERVKKLKEEYEEKIKNTDNCDKIFIDETGTALNMVLPYGRSPIGERVGGTRPTSQGERISVIGALSTEGLIASMTYEGTLNGEIFKCFLLNVLYPSLNKGRTVICDNAKAHKVRGVKEIIESKGAVMVNLPPYSPDLSPIELCWSKVKNLLKKAEARTKDDLVYHISKALNNVTEKDSKGWFNHCGYVI